MTKQGILEEIDRLRRAVEATLVEEEVYSLPTTAGIVPLALLEKQAILHAVHATEGNVILAAKLLGTGKTTIYRKLRGYRDDQQVAA